MAMNKTPSACWLSFLKNTYCFTFMLAQLFNLQKQIEPTVHGAQRYVELAQNGMDIVRRLKSTSCKQPDSPVLAMLPQAPDDQEQGEEARVEPARAMG